MADNFILYDYFFFHHSGCCCPPLMMNNHHFYGRHITVVDEISISIKIHITIIRGYLSTCVCVRLMKYANDNSSIKFNIITRSQIHCSAWPCHWSIHHQLMVCNKTCSWKCLVYRNAYINYLHYACAHIAMDMRLNCISKLINGKLPNT